MTDQRKAGSARQGCAAINAAYASVARRLRENGHSPVPLSSKRPVVSGWPAIFCERLPSLEEIEIEWASGRRGRHEMNGVGVATANGLIIIDVDDDAAVERVLAIVPQARAAPACVGQRGRKIFVRAADGRNMRERNVTGASTGGALEILAWHRQGVIPPTVHPKTGQPYVWVDDLVTLLTVPLHDLPTISDPDIDALRAAFSAANSPAIVRNKVSPRQRRAAPSMAVKPAPSESLPDRWWEASPNRAKIEQLIRLFGIVHRAAHDRGSRIVLQVDGVDASGNPHRPETIDINATEHWKHVVRIIVDELGASLEGYRLHIEVSRGNAMLGLPGGPQTYDEVGNRRFFDTVVGARAFEASSGKRARTRRTLQWWARMVEGRPALPRHERRRGLVAKFRQSLGRLQAAGIEVNVAAARQWAALIVRAGSKKLAIINEALDAIASNGGSAWLSNIAGVAATHGVTVRAVQRAISEAERAGILVRTRGNEGGKQILLSVPVVVGHDTDGNSVNRNRSPSLHRGGGDVGSEFGTALHGDATLGQPAYVENDDDGTDWPEGEDEPPPAPFGNVRRPAGEADQGALDELVEEARRGRCTEETLLLTGILPPEASRVLLGIVEQNRAGKKAGSKWLRHIANEIGELILSEPEWWPAQLQGALNYVADRLEQTKGRPTPCKWARILAENLGFIHQRAGRLTPMARAALAARLRWERAQLVGAQKQTSKEPQ